MSLYSGFSLKALCSAVKVHLSEVSRIQHDNMSWYTLTGQPAGLSSR